jgi:TetR/AcrR family transcriptional regulator, repressor for uid operon
MSPRIVDKDAKKKQIILAAMQVFSRLGVAKTKMVDIAAAAAIGKGTIYEYFRSKEQIFFTAFNTMFSEMEERLQEIVRSDKNPREKLQSLVKITLDYHSEDSGEFAAIMMDFWAEGIRNKNEQILDVINLKEIYIKFRELIAGIVKEGIKQGLFKKVDVSSYAAITIAALDGLFLQIIMEPQIMDNKKIMKTFEDTLISGLLEN